MHIFSHIFYNGDLLFQCMNVENLLRALLQFNCASDNNKEIYIYKLGESLDNR